MTNTRALDSLRAANPFGVVPREPSALEAGWLAVQANLDPHPPLRHSIRQLIRSALLVIVAALIVGTAGTALAEGGHPLRVFNRSAAANEQVVAVANVVTAYAAAHPGSGYDNVIVSPSRHTVTVVWHGPVPAGLRARLAGFRSVHVGYTAARYPARVLTESSKLLEAASQAGDFKPYGVLGVSVGPAGDGSGLAFGYEVIVGHKPAARDRIRQAAARIAGVPITNLFVVRNSSPEVATVLPSPRSS